MSRQQAAWMMLADTAPFTGHINSGFVLDNWKKWVEQDVPMTTENIHIVVAVLTVIGSVSDQLSRVALNDIKGDATVTPYTHTHSLSLALFPFRSAAGHVVYL